MPDSIRRALQATGDTYLFGLMRLCLGALLFWHALDIIWVGVLTVVYLMGVQ